MNIILCKKNLARSITWLDFWLKFSVVKTIEYNIEIECKNWYTYI